MRASPRTYASVHPRAKVAGHLGHPVRVGFAVSSRCFLLFFLKKTARVNNLALRGLIVDCGSLYPDRLKDIFVHLRLSDTYYVRIVVYIV